MAPGARRESATRRTCRAVVLVLAATGSAFAHCGDPRDIADARALIDSTCPCAGASTHAAYVQCAMTAARSQVKARRRVAGCLHDVVRCAVRSSCGRPGTVACCAHKGRASGDSGGMPTCHIVRADHCDGDGACVSPHASCCDACTATGLTPGLTGCASTTTTTATPTTTTEAATTTTSAVTTTTAPTCVLDGQFECGADAPCCGVDLCVFAVCFNHGVSACVSCIPDDGTNGCAVAGCRSDADCCTAGHVCLNLCGHGFCAAPGSCAPAGAACCAGDTVCCNGGTCPASGLCP